MAYHLYRAELSAKETESRRADLIDLVTDMAMSRRLDGVLLSAEPNAGESKLSWVTRNLRATIADGRLARGDRMPSHRDLADQWRVSRGIVTLAYEQLQTEGVLQTRKGSGTFVCAPKFLERIKASPEENINFERSPIDVRTPLIAREADVSLLALQVWQKHIDGAFSLSKTELLLDKSLMGVAKLRNEIAHYLGFARGIHCSPNDIIITTGARHAIDLTARAVGKWSRKVWTEDPGYIQAETIFRRARMEVVRVRVDGEGMVIEEGRRAAGDARLAFVTPAHQAPTGVEMSVTRRSQLLSWAEENDGYVIEDDYDGAFAYKHARSQSLKAIDYGNRVIHLGSLNKILFPALRLGYIVVPEKLRRDFQAVKAINGWSTSALEQYALASFMKDGSFARHIRNAEKTYARRSKLAVKTIETFFGGKLHTTGTHAGFHFCIWLSEPQAQSVERLSPKVKLQAIQRFNGQGILENGIVVGFAALEDDAIVEACEILGICLKNASLID